MREEHKTSIPLLLQDYASHRIRRDALDALMTRNDYGNLSKGATKEVRTRSGLGEYSNAMNYPMKRDGLCTVTDWFGSECQAAVYKSPLQPYVFGKYRQHHIYGRPT